jgi:hypothetical protein
VLGCGPDVGRHTWLKSRGLQEMRSILASANLSQLARDYGDALRKVERNKLLPRLPRTPSTTEVPGMQALPPVEPTRPPLPSGGDNESTQHRAAEHSQVFGIVSPSFGGTASKQPARKLPQPPVVTSPPLASTPPEDLYAHAHGVSTLLIHAWETFDQRGGDWTRADVQEDLARLRTLVTGYIKRGSSSVTH